MNRPEIFIGLIAPIGVDLDLLQDELSNGLREVSYLTRTIRFTETLEAFSHHFLLNTTSYKEKYETYIESGNRFCESTKREDILALGAISNLIANSDGRKPVDVNHRTPAFNTATIFRQIKRVREIQTLREAYGNNVIFIGCYAPKKVRENYLIDLLLKSDRDSNHDQLRADALSLIGKDANQTDDEYGQKFLECYPFADFIIDCTDKASLTTSIERFVKCFFGSPFVSPSVDEYALAISSLVAMRSADLSRQVGAAIFSDTREIISLGCNEVAKFGGGTYWEDTPNDKRDFQRGFDSNYKTKSDMIRDLLVKLSSSGWLMKNKPKRPDELLEAAIADDGPLSHAMIGDVIEFGRMLHAEMNAIVSAGRSGRSLQDASLYCTTMPCHMCTKLIVGSGIKEVVYLQPYHKSLVEELFEDSVCIDDNDNRHVVFRPFHGVTPNAYQNVFSKGKRKTNDGSALSWNPTESLPVGVSSLSTYLRNEENAAQDWKSCIKESGIPLPRRSRKKKP